MFKLHLEVHNDQGFVLTFTLDAPTSHVIQNLADSNLLVDYSELVSDKQFSFKAAVIDDMD
ncbi:hypothetical protein PsorP6_008369 [Peronosclerospora sorghi]|uniref:Uncharacterized protein n=1 Tax=Peronosclerospora sorghi TaxID=230839 RepID=A0ACC0W7Y2_9STRA|nr:hypothetical protein PsorP6_008369 [Peronosclerospora sorghi]